jgi:hypothetical protein
MGQTTISAPKRKSEESAIGLGGDEQLGDDGGDAAKVAGAGCAVEAITEAGDLGKCGAGPVGVELFDRGREEDIGAPGFGERAVGFEGAWIAGVVLVGAELRGVDEEADCDVVTRSARRMNQRRVSCMQRTHGGNQTDPVGAIGVALRATSCAGPAAKFGNSAEDFHRAWLNLPNP